MRCVAAEDNPGFTRRLTAADDLTALADLYRLEKKNIEANKFYSRALKILENSTNNAPYKLANVLNGLACLQYQEGKNEAADQLFKRAISIDETALGKDHANTKEIRDNYHIFLERTR